MGIFNKLFGKKKSNFQDSMPAVSDDFDVGGPWEDPQVEPEFREPGRREEMSQYHVPQENQPRVSGERFEGSISPKDVQLILSKLDLISSRLDNLNRRIEAMETANKNNIW
jgi:hypothetical protein